MLPTSHVPAEEQLIQHHEKPGDIVFQKEINSLPEKKKKTLKEYYPNERQFKMAIVKKHRKTQKGITMRSRIILLYRRNPLPKRLKL